MTDRFAIIAAAVVCTFGMAAASSSGAQQGAQAAAQPARQTPRQAALVDPVGYWVSIVTEDWRLRMLAAPRGDATGIPLNAEGRKVAAGWDPVKDEASGHQCKAFGAAGIIRIPGRLHITWQDDSTLTLAADAGRQTRRFHFGNAPRPVELQLQGHSVASWEREGPRGTLKVVTTGMQAGYLRKNGIPYSDKAVLTEYFDRHAGPHGDQWLTVTSIVLDPTYLQREYVTSTDFKQEPSGAKWNPTPCEILLSGR